MYKHVLSINRQRTEQQLSSEAWQLLKILMATVFNISETLERLLGVLTSNFSWIY